LYILDTLFLVKNFGAMVDKLEETHKTKIDQLMDESINKTTRLAELSTRLHEQEAKIEKLENDAEHEERAYVHFDKETSEGIQYRNCGSRETTRSRSLRLKMRDRKIQ
jgi:hypothetical protein